MSVVEQLDASFMSFELIDGSLKRRLKESGPDERVQMQGLEMTSLV